MKNRRSTYRRYSTAKISKWIIKYY